jgi:hypothetical protein
MHGLIRILNWWGEKDSNLRKLTLTELQSVPFGHSGIPPNADLIDNKSVKPYSITPFKKRCSF